MSGVWCVKSITSFILIQAATFQCLTQNQCSKLNCCRRQGHPAIICRFVPARLKSVLCVCVYTCLCACRLVSLRARMCMRYNTLTAWQNSLVRFFVLVIKWRKKIPHTRNKAYHTLGTKHTAHSEQFQFKMSKS